MSGPFPGRFPGTFRTAALALVMLASCKTKPADPPASRPTAPRSAPAAAPTLPESSKPADPAAQAAAAAAAAAAQARGIAAIQHLADTLAVEARDCDKLAVDLRAFIADNQPLLAQLMASASQPTDPQVGDRAAASAAARSLQTAIAGCVASPAVAAAIKDLPAP